MATFLGLCHGDAHDDEGLLYDLLGLCQGEVETNETYGDGQHDRGTAPRYPGRPVLHAKLH